MLRFKPRVDNQEEGCAYQHDQQEKEVLCEERNEFARTLLFLLDEEVEGLPTFIAANALIPDYTSCLAVRMDLLLFFAATRLHKLGRDFQIL